LSGRYKAILFDLDGTLVDSVHDICEAANVALRERDLPTLSAKLVRGMIGDGLPKLAERALQEAGGRPDQLREFTARVSGYYEKHATVFTRCYPAAYTVLRELRAGGFKLGVVTNKPTSMARNLLRDIELLDMLKVVAGGDSLPRKPEPAQILEAIRVLGVDAKSVMMVGDSAHDIDAAHAAGIPSVAVTYGYYRSDDPSSFGADHVIDSLQELLSQVLGLPLAHDNRSLAQLATRE
jgi:phosphoglycolate phosphatase